MKRRNLTFTGYREQIQSELTSVIVITTFQDYMQFKANLEARDQVMDTLTHHRHIEGSDPIYIQDPDKDMETYILSSRDNFDFRQRFGIENSGRN